MADTSSGVDNSKESSRLIPKGILMPFILVTSLFALWGFANDITNPMVAAFKNILLISNFQSSLVQFAFYGGYCVMAIPAALFIKRFSYKSGILVGLSLYTLGCLLFVPAGWMMAFPAFLLSYFIITCGLSFLETSSNPYILAMGPEETSTRRLNYAQSFNPMGSIVGMFIAMNLILANLNPMSEAGRRYVQGMAEGQTYHQQIIDAASASLSDAKREPAGGDVDYMQQKVKAAYAELILLSPEWTEKAAAAKKILAEASDAGQKVQEMFEGQDAFTNLRTGEIDGGALDRAVLAREEYGQGPGALKTALASARSEALAAIVDLIPVATIAAPTEADLRQAITTALPLLSNASKTLAGLDTAAVERASTEAQQRLLGIQQADLDVIIGPYTVLGVVVFAMLLVFAFSKLPRSAGEDDNKLELTATLKRLWANKKYIEGVVAQTFYVGVQIMCWTFIIQYAEDSLGMAKPVAQKYNIIAMAIFVSSRFICTHLLKYFSPGGLLMSLALSGLGLIIGVIFIQGMTGLYCLIGVSACMSLMFPTIYGIALKGLGDDAKLGSAGLIMAIGGGSVMPPMQAAIMDMPAFNFGFMTLSSVRVSFVLPLICFVVIAIFGFRTSKVHGHKY